MKNVRVLLLALIVLSLSCKKDNPPTAESSPLIKTKWILTQIQNTKTKEVINYPSDARKKITISFSDSMNILNFSGVWNGGSGQYSYSVADGTIKVTDFFTTLIYGKYVEWEDYVRDNFYEASRYKTYGDTLEIESKGTYNLFFVKTQY